MLTDPRRQRRSNGSVCDVALWSGRHGKYTAYLVGNCPSLCTVGQTAHFGPALPSEHPESSLGESRHVVLGQHGQRLLSIRGAPYMERVSAGHQLQATRSLSRAGSPGVSTWSPGFRRVQHAAQAHVRADPLVAHAVLLHQVRRVVRVQHLPKQFRLSGRLLAELQPAARQVVQLPLGRLPVQGPRRFAPLRGDHARHAGDHERALLERRLAQVVRDLRQVRSCERLREYTMYLVGNCSSLCLPVNQLFSNLRYLRSIPSHRRVNHNWHTASEANACFLLAELTLWVNYVVNKFLWVKFEIQAVSTGWLALARLHGRVVLVSSNMQRRHSFVRVCPMVLELRSVKFLELCEPRISQNHFLFRGDFRLSRHMWYVKLCHYLLEDYSNKCLIEAPHSPVTTLDTLESVSVRFSIVGVQMLGEIFGNCEPLRVPVLLENWIDVPATEELRRADAQRSVQRRIHVHELFATLDSCYILAD
ncbi:hypothetical protein HPB49_024691 [Dermacentor silvarum]|uniref:Uncharacterized protein n=1 Tax=Dermacentor silvarum TaxID=543639 RepID=A0ACB8E4K8_DERSI|nr:hypothetical protein HPB49_024691 [Dermacentor silvarum]